MTRLPPQSALQARAALLQPPARYPLDGEAFVRLRDRLASFSGVYLDVARQRILEQAVARRLSACDLDLASYERRIAVDRAELQRLAELVLNHETFFFRNQPHMRALAEVILPELHRRKPHGEPIRIWSAGCASGEEAYSLAITALECFPLGSRPIEIWATDLSEAALELGREGYYGGRSLVNVPEALLTRYFQPHGQGYTVNERVRSLVRFERLNLLEPLPAKARGIDIIFCQNVIIYFQMATSRTILGQFFELLPEGGMLFLGFSETLWTIFDAFHTREVLGAYVYYKETYQPEKRTTAPLRGPVPPRTPVAKAEPPVRPVRQTRPLAAPIESSGDAEALRGARELLAAKRGGEALAVLQQITPSSPLATQALTLTARIHADQGQFELALAAAQRVVAVDALNDEATLLLGTLYSRQNMWAAAIEQFERARYLNSGAPLVSFSLAEAYRQHDRSESALREYRAALRKLQLHPPDVVIDGVAVGWLQETCERQIAQLAQHMSEQ